MASNNDLWTGSVDYFAPRWSSHHSVFSPSYQYWTMALAYDTDTNQLINITVIL